MSSDFDPQGLSGATGRHRAGRSSRPTAGEVYRRAGAVPPRVGEPNEPTRAIPTEGTRGPDPSPQFGVTPAPDGRASNAGTFRAIPARNPARDDRPAGSRTPGSRTAGTRTDRVGRDAGRTQAGRGRRPTPERPAAAAGRGRPRGLIAGRAALVVCSIIAFVITGAMWMGANVVRGGLGYSNALAGAPRSSGGAQNILLIGLDTRKDKDGNDLPDDVMRQLHAGDGDSGGYNTNTLILMHIPADRKNIVAFSIPRDDLISVSGLDVSQAKIKEVYGRTKAMTEDKLVNDGVNDQATLESRGRDAGRKASIAAVRELTGVPIDRFAEVSLIGFYDVAKALGGVQVCLNHAVSDDYSGANFSAGTHRLSAAQALAFVRQRHGLTRGDLDRTHRQQAFLLSALHQVQSAGTLTDVGKLNRLMGVVDDDVVFSQGWDVVSWAQDMVGTPGQQISFSTLPVLRYATVDGQDVNIINPTAIRAQVQRAFGVAVPTTPPPGATAASAASSADATAALDDSSQDTGDPSAPAPDSGPAVVNTGTIPCVD